jgi:hypothetical protein
MIAEAMLIIIIIIIHIIIIISFSSSSYFTILFKMDLVWPILICFCLIE